MSDRYATDRSFAAPVGAWPAAGWWMVYGDSQLDALIEEGLAGSPSVRSPTRACAALAPPRTARAARSRRRSAPAAGDRAEAELQLPEPRGRDAQGWNDYGRATLDFSWELDFWGKNRAALAAATSEAIAAAGRRGPGAPGPVHLDRLGYAELARLYSALDTATAARDLRAKTAELFAPAFRRTGWKPAAA